MFSWFLFQVQKQYHQHFFTDLMEKHGIGLENLIYYKDLTHYFVMTATKVPKSNWINPAILQTKTLVSGVSFEEGSSALQL